MPKKPAIGQTGLILGIGAVGLGLLLLPGFFQRREAPGDDAGLFDWEPEALLPEPEASKVVQRGLKEEEEKAGFQALGRPTLSVTAVRSTPANGVGSHMRVGPVDIWQADGIEIVAAWEIQNLTNERLPVDFQIRLRQVRDFTTGSFFFGEGWGDIFGRDVNTFEYTPGQGVKEDGFYKEFGAGVKTTHGASMGSLARSLTVDPNKRERLRMGFILPGPARSKALRKFWESRPEWNFKIAVYQGETRFAEHEFKGAFTTSRQRPVVLASPTTYWPSGGKFFETPKPSPRLIVRSLNYATKKWSSTVRDTSTAEDRLALLQKWGRAEALELDVR